VLVVEAQRILGSADTAAAIPKRRPSAAINVNGGFQSFHMPFSMQELKKYDAVYM